MVFLTGVALQLFGADAIAREPVECRPVDDDRELSRRRPSDRHRTVQCRARQGTVRRGAPPPRQPVRRPVRRPPPPPPPRRVVSQPVTRAPVRDRGPVRPRKPTFNRENTLAIGLTGGSFVSGNPDAGVFADGGIGAWVRARPRGPIAAQLDIGHYFGVTHRPLLQQAREQTQVAGSMMWFLAPQSPVAPYALGGLTYTHQVLQDQTFGNDFPEHDNLFGLTAGGGLEIALGRSAVLDLEGRYVGYLNRDANDPLGTVTATVGIGTHF